MELCSLGSPALVRFHDCIHIQPGVSRRIRSPGKSNFLKFMLAWLLSKQQVVILCNNALQYLFYRDKVYSRPTALGFVHLPYHPGHPRRSVWGLIDIDFDDRGPPINSDLTIWPIQATSPKSIRWKSWRKQLDGAMWGMPLWSLEELIEGYASSSFYRPSRGSSTAVRLRSLSLSPGYNALRTMLEEYLPQLDGLTAPETGDPKVDAILEVLHLEREREKVVAAAEKEEEEDYPRELRDDIRAPTRDQEQMLVDQAEQQVPAYRIKLEKALAILVRTATEEFGFIPRDVYNGIVDLPGKRRQHAEAVDGLDYSNLSNLIRAFTYNKELGMTSRCVFVMFPTENWTTTDDWKIDFKSVRVAELAGEALRRGEDQRIREIYNSIRGLWDGSTLAGRIFEPIAHQVFREGSALQYYPMTSTAAGVEPPTFSTLTTAPASDLPSFPGGRVDTTVDFKSKLSNVTLESNRYYVPAGTNHPLFDSFTIDSISRPVVISVFQMTIASKHQGSAQSYFQIRRLKTHVRKLFKDMGVTPPTIEARYFLVCPEDEVERRWEMPAGWGKGERNTHRGKVFYLRVPSPRRT